jgi:hypothetical protein
MAADLLLSLDTNKKRLMSRYRPNAQFIRYSRPDGVFVNWPLPEKKKANISFSGVKWKYKYERFGELIYVRYSGFRCSENQPYLHQTPLPETLPWIQ